MKKYQIGRKLVEVACDNCGKKYEKVASEYKRNQKKGRKSYCSRECAGNSVKIPKDFVKKIPKEHSRFRYYLRNCKRRTGECTLTLEDLNNQWVKQNGKCAYLNIDLHILTHSNVSETKHLLNKASIDRIDPNKGYIPGNIQFIFYHLNLMKHELSDDKTHELLNLISTNYN